MATNEQAYLEQPPTVSRALTNPLVTEPFAIVMLVGAALLLIALVQLTLSFRQLLRDYPETDTRLNRFLITFSVVCEVPAILGMVVLSQYTGDAHSKAHDTGSYMLFFGHAFAILTCGILVRRILRQTGKQGDARLAAIARHPTHSTWVMISAVAFGIAYFSGKIASAEYSYVQHLMTSVTEIIVLLAFLSFLGRFWKFVLTSAHLKSVRRSSPLQR